MNKAQKHTPGPWFMVDNAAQAIGRGCEICIDDAEGGNEERDYFLASALHGDPDELLANARLIASAPELLAVCSEVESLLPQLVDVDGCEASANVLVRVRAAIAKAAGTAA